MASSELASERCVAERNAPTREDADGQVIGMDVHAASCTAAVYGTGRRDEYLRQLPPPAGGAAERRRRAGAIPAASPPLTVDPILGVRGHARLAAARGVPVASGRHPGRGARGCGARVRAR